MSYALPVHSLHSRRRLELSRAHAGRSAMAAVARRPGQESHLAGEVLGRRQVDRLAQGDAKGCERVGGAPAIARIPGLGPDREQLDVLEGEEGAAALGRDEDVDTGPRCGAVAERLAAGHLELEGSLAACQPTAPAGRAAEGAGGDVAAG